MTHVNNFLNFKGALNRAFTHFKSNIFIVSEKNFFIGEK